MFCSFCYCHCCPFRCCGCYWPLLIVVGCCCKPSVLSYRLHISLLLFLVLELRPVTNAITGTVSGDHCAPDATHNVLLHAVDGARAHATGPQSTSGKVLLRFSLTKSVQFCSSEGVQTNDHTREFQTYGLRLRVKVLGLEC